jgi:F-type H+-transporting ATPase subunit alpha
VSIYAATSGFVDDIPVGDVRRFESELISYFRSRHSDLLDEIRDTKVLPDTAKLDEAIKAFKAVFAPSES